MSETGGMYIDINGITDSHSIERAEMLLRNIPGAADKAIRSATDRAAAYLRTASIRHIRERYDISAKNVRNEDTFQVKYIRSQGLSVTISFAGHKIPLYRYGGTSPKQPVVGELVKAHVMKVTRPYPFYHAFVATMQNSTGNNHTGIFERTGYPSARNPRREAIREITGLSVKQMLNNEETRNRLTMETVDKWEERIEHEINAFLNGWR